jgi:hypothetical protein
MQPIPYSEFLTHLKVGRMGSVSIGSQFIEGKLKASTPDGRTRIVTTRVAPDLARELAQSSYSAAREYRVGPDANPPGGLRLIKPLRRVRPSLRTIDRRLRR